MDHSNPAQAKIADTDSDSQMEDAIAYLSKRHRVSPAVVREIIRRIGTSERAAVEREIRKGMARR